MLDRRKLMQVELVARCLMALILLVAGSSKLMADGGFQTYYLGLFSNQSLRINLPSELVLFYLSAIPWVEIGLGIALLFARFKPVTLYAWYLFMASLLVGHYVLQEWSSVNQMLPYFFLGMLCHMLPNGSDH